MSGETEEPNAAERQGKRFDRRKGRRSRRWVIIGWLAAIVVVVACATAWLGIRAAALKDELQTAANLVSELKKDITANRPEEAATNADRLRLHTASAREIVADPLWTISAAIPWIGPNFSAAAEVARSADDVATMAVSPLVQVFDSLDWGTLMPKAGGADLEPLRKAAPSVAAASDTVSRSADRLAGIRGDQLLPQLASALAETRGQLAEASSALDVAASASQLAPEMLGADAPKKYLLLVQNNDELRASGGIPASVAVITVDHGKLSLSGQTTAEAMGTMSPLIDVDPEQKQIYTGRIGKYMQDVNLTPDFPTAAATARSMWQQKTGEQVDGVVSIDPVALSFLLNATGPLKLDDSRLASLSGNTMPSELTADNAIKTLLSDVYARIPSPKAQDVYFAAVAKRIFDGLASASTNPQKLLSGLTRGVQEGRILVWSADANEQRTLASYRLGGSIAGPSVSPAQFGVYFNDGTGAKMDYYIKSTVQLVKECPQAGYEQTSVRVTFTNTASADAATSLPKYVTGASQFGVPLGSVLTNIVAYGPVQANMETAKLDGQRTEFAPYQHSNRPVGVLAVQLAPGETKTVEFTFGKIVQHTEPNVVVTPTVQDVKDVILPTQKGECMPVS